MKVARMGRGVRFAALVLAAVSLSAAYPKQTAAEPTGNENQQIAAALENVATALKQQPKSDETEKPCARSHDNRSSDLCAQWKAADAASEAADVAFWIGLIGSLLAGLTLFVAVRAALYARDAAAHTETGAKAAEDALEHERARTRIEFRPWLTLAVRADAHLMIYEGKLDFGVIVDVGNVGKTIASEVVVLADFMNEPTVGVRDAIVEKLRAKTGDLQARSNYHKKIVFPGTPVPIFAAVKRAPSAKKEIYRIITFVGYRDRLTGQPYETWGTFDVFKLTGDVYNVIDASDLPLGKEHIVIHPTGIGEAT